MKRFLCFFIVFMIILQLSALDVIEKIPSGTRFFAKLDLKTLRQNSFYIKLQNQNKEQLNFFSAIFALMSGINIDDINSIYLIAHGQDDGFILLEGNFQVDRIKQIVSMNRENQVTELENTVFAVEIPDKKKPGTMNLAVIIDDATIAIGKGNRVQEFVGLINGKGNLLDQRKINALKEEYLDSAILHFSIIELLPEMMEDQILKNFSGAELKADLNEGLLINMKIFMIDSQIAKATEQIINGLVVYLKRVELPELRKDETIEILKNELLETITAQSNGDEVLLKAKMEEQSLEKIIEIQRKKVQLPGGVPTPPEKKDNNDVFDTGKE